MKAPLLLLGAASLAWGFSYDSVNLSSPLCSEVFGFDLVNSTPVAMVEASVQVSFALIPSARSALVFAMRRCS
jgi:hypothetical protein